MKVTKRNGSIVDYDATKICKAVERAFDEVGEARDDERFVNLISSIIEEVYIKDESSDTPIGVEEIQDIVENELMEYQYKTVAKAYIRYRYDHELKRQKAQEKSFFDAVEEKLMASNVQNQNANIDEYSFGGRMGEANDVLMRKFALDHLISPMAKNNHLNNEIYIHDLSHYAVGDHNCLSIPFDKLLANGFNTRQTDVRPANSINTAMQLVAVIFQLQSLMQFGGVAATHLDWTMVPYVRKSFNKHYCDGLRYIENQPEQIEAYKHPSGSKVEDVSIEDKWYKDFPRVYQYALDMTKKETHQAVEGMYHNLNTLQSRSGNQLK